MAFDLLDCMGVPQNFDPQRLYVTSPWFSPRTLAAIRGVIALYTMGVLMFVLIWDALVLKTAQQFFSFFTELTHIGICSYYWASFVQTFIYARRVRLSPGRIPEYPLQRWPKYLQVLHALLDATVVSYPILVTAVFWGLLASPSVFKNSFSAWSNISMHALNTVWSLFEMLGTNSPPPRWIMLPPVAALLIMYMGLAYVTHATQGFYPYAFLNPDNGHALLAGYLIGILIAGCISFVIGKTIMWARVRLARDGVQSSSSSTGDDDKYLPETSFADMVTTPLVETRKDGAGRFISHGGEGQHSDSQV